ncbi:MAG: dienelactone hydrolase [Hyphomicrobiales bacterium]|nr:dienelactone hydrolase [Hyphomicrobiales bacterium]
MAEQIVEFVSDGLKLIGTVSTPEGLSPDDKRPAFIVLHGFGSTRHAGNVVTPCAMLNKLGYVTLRFDMRGCGESEGERGRLICLEQVTDTRNALTMLQQHANIDPARIGVMGSSFGAAVAVYTAGSDKRVGACVSASGWGNGALKFEGQHSGPGEFERFKKMLADGKAHREKTGQAMMVSRYDIVPIPVHLRGNVLKGSIIDMPVDTAQSMYDFTAEDMIAEIAPRPVLLMHSAVDSVTPTVQTIRMFERSKSPTELHLFSGTDHFMFAEHNTRVHQVVTAWLEAFFPVSGEPAPMVAGH